MNTDNIDATKLTLRGGHAVPRRTGGGVCASRHALLSPPVLLAMLALPALALAAGSARAADGDAFTLNAGVSQQHDSNLFRLPDDADTRSVLGSSTKADDITVMSVGVDFDKRYSLQRFRASASLIDHRYRNFDYLDFTARNYSAAWDWSLTPALHGELASERSEALNSFIDYTGYGTRNVRTDKKHSFDAVYEFRGPWRLLGGVAETTRNNSAEYNQEGDSRLRSAEGGVRYDYSSGTTLGLVARSGRGEYVNRDQPIDATLLDNRFDQREYEVRLHWPLSVKTTLDLRAARLEREHAHFAGRDYSGAVGRADVRWRITDKTSLVTTLGRELTSYQAEGSSYIQTDRLTLSPIWQVGAKTTLRARLDYARRDYRGAVAASALADRFDTQRSALLAVDWRPIDKLALTASLQNEQRSSNRSAYDYDATIAGVSALYAF